MKTLVLVALEKELSTQHLHPHCIIHYTGIGKISAAIETLTAIYHYQPEFVINYGSAGAVNPNVSGLIEIKSVFQHDFQLDPPAKRGHGQNQKILQHTNPLAQEHYRCATGDRFITQKEEWFDNNQIDVVEMELFAIVSCCIKMNISWRAFKFISDQADEEAQRDYEKHCGEGENLFIKKIKEIL